MRSLTHQALLTGIIVGIATALGCSSGAAPASTTESDGTTGTVGMELQLAPGVTVNTISWTIANATTGFSQSGTVNVQNSNTVRFRIGALPAGTGYTITLSATSVDGTITCSGSASFNVTAGTNTGVSVTLLCSGATPDAGTIVVTGTTQLCANINSISALPLETSVDSTIALSATASAGSAKVTYSWDASNGSFDNPASATPIYTCPSSAGTFVITLTVFPSAPVCTTNVSQSVEVTCSALTPTFTNVYANVIGQRCTGCHRPGGGGFTVGGLDMSAQALAYANLVGVPAAGTGLGASGITCSSVMPPLVRIVAGDSANSLLFNKVNSKLQAVPAPCGSPMPTPATAVPLRATQVALIKAWIDNGAQND